ncbi:MAG: hypothetical protein WC498_00405 [Candidatus Saccharimonadales bacterium]
MIDKTILLIYCMRSSFVPFRDSEETIVSITDKSEDALSIFDWIILATTNLLGLGAGLGLICGGVIGADYGRSLTFGVTILVALAVFDLCVFVSERKLR